MKTVFTLFSMFVLSCKTKKQSVTMTKKEVAIPGSRTIGKISHEYHKNGYQTVIVIYDDAQKTKILAPINKLDTAIDIDGLEVSFMYHFSKKSLLKGNLFGIPGIICQIQKI